MTLAKDKGLSCHKGKEVAADDPPTKAVGKEAPFTESNRSEEEERGRNPNSECPSFIDSWYDSHTHFPVVLGNYLPLPMGCVWLSICCCDIEVSWASLASSIFDLDIHQGTSLLVPILFEFVSGTSLGWKE